MHVVFISDFGYPFITLFLTSLTLDLMLVHLHKSFTKRIHRSHQMSGFLNYKFISPTFFIVSPFDISSWFLFNNSLPKSTKFFNWRANFLKVFSVFDKLMESGPNLNFLTMWDFFLISSCYFSILIFVQLWKQIKFLAYHPKVITLNWLRAVIAFLPLNIYNSSWHSNVTCVNSPPLTPRNFVLTFHLSHVPVAAAVHPAHIAALIGRVLSLPVCGGLLYTVVRTRVILLSPDWWMPMTTKWLLPSHVHFKIAHVSLGGCLYFDNT